MKRQPITQESWVDALVTGWGKHKSLGGALLLAAKFDPEVVKHDDWEEMVAEASKLRPRLNPNTPLKQQISVWIASKCVKANALLWDGKIESAKKWMASGKDCAAPHTVRKKTIKDIDDEYGKQKNSLFVSRRAINADRTAWNKVK